MIIKTYGDEHLPKILGLHPMMASGESMLRLAFTNGLMSESMLLWFGSMLLGSLIHKNNC